MGISQHLSRGDYKGRMVWTKKELMKHTKIEIVKKVLCLYRAFCSLRSHHLKLKLDYEFIKRKAELMGLKINGRDNN